MKVRTKRITMRTLKARFITFVLYGTKRPKTIFFVQADVSRFTKIERMFGNRTTFNFFRNSSRVFTKRKSNVFKRQVRVERSFNEGSIISSKVFTFRSMRFHIKTLLKNTELDDNNIDGS